MTNQTNFNKMANWQTVGSHHNGNLYFTGDRGLCHSHIVSYIINWPVHMSNDGIVQVTMRLSPLLCIQCVSEHTIYSVMYSVCSTYQTPSK